MRILAECRRVLVNRPQQTGSSTLHVAESSQAKDHGLCQLCRELRAFTCHRLRTATIAQPL